MREGKEQAKLKIATAAWQQNIVQERRVWRKAKVVAMINRSTSIRTRKK